MRVVGKRLYRDGTEELIVEPPPIGFSIWCCSASESKALELLNKGLREEARKLSFKIAVACLCRKCYKERDYCKSCFFRDLCGLWISPKWFFITSKLREAVLEIALYNSELRCRLPWINRINAANVRNPPRR